MVDVGIRALKQNASSVVARVKEGEIVTITDHGVPVARLMPIVASTAEELVASGKLRPPDAAAELPAMPLPLDGGPNLSTVLDEQREDRL